MTDPLVEVARKKIPTLVLMGVGAAVAILFLGYDRFGTVTPTLLLVAAVPLVATGLALLYIRNLTRKAEAEDEGKHEH